MENILNYKDILDINREEFLDDMMYQIIENADNAIIYEAKSSYKQLEEVSKDFFNYIDKNVTDAINKLKDPQNKNVEIKLNESIKKAMALIDKEVPDMLTGMNKYTKSTVYGKCTLAGAVVASWTVPALIVTPGTTEMIFTAAEVLNYLLEFPRRWNGSNRSAINDFIVRCSKATDEISTSNISADKTCMNVIKFFKYMKSIVSQIVNGTMIALQGGIIKGYKKVYRGTEVIGNKIDKATEDSTSKIGKSVNKFGKKLEDVSRDLKNDSDKAIEARNVYKVTKKDIREAKKKLKLQEKEKKRQLKAKE